MALCQGCGLDKKLIKAHAIPESFFVKMRSEHGAPKLMTDVRGTYPKKSPIGVYDNQILCRDCEDRFEEVDDYAQKLLLQSDDNHEKLIIRGKLIGYKVKDADYRKLKLFFISVLWRASLSKQKFYERINQGPYQEKAKDLIWASDPGKQSDFPFLVAKFTDTSIGKIILNPHPERWSGVNYNRIYLYGYVVYVKMDKRNSPDMFAKFEMVPDGDLIIVGRNIENSAELPVMTSVVKNASK